MTPLLSVINNVLSEGGGLQLDGAPVSTAGVTVLFPMLLSPETLHAPSPQADGEEGSPAEVDGELERAAKDELCSRLEARPAVGEADTSDGVAVATVGAVMRALRRRIDIVFPVLG